MKEPQIRFSLNKSSYERKRLNDIAEINPKGTLPESFEYVDLESVVGTVMKKHRKENKTTAPSRAQRVARKGDIFYQTVRPYQKNNFHFDLDSNDFVFSSGYAQIRSAINSEYLFTLLQHDKFLNQVLENCTGTSYPAINPSNLSKLVVNISTDIKEQQDIADFFKTFDLYIQGISNKVASLKQIKSACLQSMFPQEGESVPKVRFKGFNEEWRTKRLSDCLLVSHDKNIDNIYNVNDVLSVSDDYGVKNQIELLGRSYAGKSVSKYGILHKEEIVFTKSPLKTKPFGIVKMNTYKTGIVSVLYAIYKANKNISPLYIHYYFDPAWRLNKYLSPLVNKGAKNTMNISDEYALSGEIMIPSFQEQQKIAAYFENLDKQISLQAQRLEKLKQIKSACLDKMFV